MGEDLARFGAHPLGEQSPVEPDASGMGVVVDSFAGSVRVEWDHATAFTPLGQLPFFIDFLKTAGLFDSFVADSPLNYREPECVQDPRRFGHGDVVDVGWTQALFSYRGVA